MLKKSILSVITAVFIFLSGLLFFPPVAFSQTSADTLVYGRGADADKLDPADTTDGEATKILYQIFDGLVNYKKTSSEIEPGLAVSWDVNSDGTVLTFYLRKEVKFHDGTPFDAESVVFSFLRQMNPKNPYYGKFENWEAVYAPHIKEVKALDKYTVQIILYHPFAPIFNCLAMYSARIVSPEAMRKLGKDGFAKKPVGTGPFKFFEWAANDRIVLERNNYYWGKKAGLERVIYKVIKENSLRTLQLESGTIDLLDGIDPDSADRIRRNSQLVVNENAGINVCYLAMNCERKPFTDKRVRKGINYAINKEPIIKLIYQGLGIPAKNPMPPTLLGYNDEIKPYEYNPEKAKRLFAEAGYPEGFEFTLDVMENPRPYVPDPVKLAEAIKENLSLVGVRVNLRINKWQDHRQRLIKDINPNYDAGIYGWFADYPDPDDFLFVLLDKNNTNAPRLNLALYKNDKLHEILVNAQQAGDIKARSRLYKKAQEIIHEDAPWVPLAHAVCIFGSKKSVTGAYINPSIQMVFLSEAQIKEPK